MSFRAEIIIGLAAAVVLGFASRRRLLPVPAPRGRFHEIGGAMTIAALLVLLLLSVTGFAPFFSSHPLSGYPLLWHTFAGACLLFIMPALALLRGERFAAPAIRAPHRFFFWSFLFFGLLSGVTILLSMSPIEGPAGIAQLLAYHRCASLLTVMAFIAFIVSR